MAENERLGASFSIDTTALKAGLAQANRLIRESESEFKAAAAGMDDWTESQEGLEARLNHLNKTQDLQKKKVEALKKAYQENVDKGLDPMSASMVKLRTDINKEQEALNKTEKEIKKNKKAIEDLGDESNNAGKQVKKLGDEAKKSGDGFTVLKGVISNVISKGLHELVKGCKKAIKSLYNLSDATQEYREDLGKLETAFEAAGKSTDIAKETYKKFYSVLGEEDRSVEAVNHLAQFVSTQEDMAKWTDICAGVWGTFGDSLPIEGLTEAANETAKTGEVTGVLADALNWAGISQDDFQKQLEGCSSETERAALITETLNKQYGDAADKYKENNKSVMEAREATAKLKDTQAELGAKLEPITTKIKEGFAKILDKLLELTNNVDLEAFGERVDAAFDKFINEILPKILEGLQWIWDNKDLIIAAIAGIGAAFVAWKAYSIITNVVKAIKTMTTVFKALNLVMKANPIGLIITAIGLLVGAFTLLWQKSEKFRNFWKGLWEGCKDMFKGFVNGVIKGLNFLIRGLNKIHFDIPDWVPAIGGKEFGIKLKEIPLMAKGGVVKQATTAVIGEDGAEAVVPLEKNKQWIKSVAEELKGMQTEQKQQPQPVVINQTNNYSQSHSRYELYKSKQQTAAAVKLALRGV